MNPRSLLLALVLPGTACAVEYERIAVSLADREFLSKSMTMPTL